MAESQQQPSTPSSDKPPKEAKASIWDKFKFFLQLRDGIWSIPLLFIVGFLFMDRAMHWLFGEGAGTYDSSFFQALFISVLVVVGAVNFGLMGMYMTFRGLHRFLYGYKMEDGKYFNKSKQDFESISPWQRLKISLAAFSFFVLCILLVYVRIR